MESKNYFDTLEVDKWRDVLTYGVFGYALSSKHEFFKRYPVDRKKLTKMRQLLERKINQPFTCKKSPSDIINLLAEVMGECEQSDSEVHQIINDLLNSSYIERVKKLYNDQLTEKAETKKRKNNECCNVLSELNDHMFQYMEDSYMQSLLQSVHDVTDILKNRVKKLKSS